MSEPPAPPFPAPATPPGTRAWLWGLWRRERRQAEDLRRRAQWLQAELENLRKQADRDRAQARERAAEGLVARMLPVLDGLDHAVGADPRGEVAAGLALVRGELAKVLADEGLAPIPAEGQAFDALHHEAVQRAERPCADGEAPGLRVEAELRRGYTFRGRVVRPAMVRVVELTPRPAARATERGA